MWGEDAGGDGHSDPTLECCRPLGVEVYRLPEGFLDAQGWVEPAPFGQLYKGHHGYRAAAWGA